MKQGALRTALGAGLCLLAGVAGAETPPATPAAASRIALTRWAGLGAVLGWGLLQWDYGAQGAHLAHEGWFERDTPEGGADKLGHFYTGYVLSRAFAGLYARWTPPADAAREAALTALLLTSAIEAGDAFSPYGLSREDLVMNALGSGLGYALARHTHWRERLDVRVEYRVNGHTDDITTDYEHSRYLVALKPAGFAALRRTPLRWLELQVGYYARGYGAPAAPDRRVSYVALGLNLVALGRAAGLHRTATFLQFYQIPDSTLRAEHERR